MKKRDAVPVAEKYLDIVGLSEYEKAPVTALSGGQQQRGGACQGNGYGAESAVVR